MTPAERSLRARLAAHTRLARCSPEDRRDMTAPARDAFAARFERQVDPDGLLDPTERATRARHAMKAHMARLALSRHQNR